MEAIARWNESCPEGPAPILTFSASSCPQYLTTLLEKVILLLETGDLRADGVQLSGREHIL